MEIGSAFRRAVAVVLLLGGPAMAADPGLPKVGGKKALAAVNGEPVTLEEFREVLSSLHMNAAGKPSPGKRNYTELLQRMINGKLIVQEARNIGLDSLPEIQDTVKAAGRQFRRQTLLVRQVRSVRPPEKEVERNYRDSVREVLIVSYLFEKEEEAKRAEEEIRSGLGYDSVMKRMASEGKARGTGEEGYVKWKDLAPEISGEVLKLDDNGISPVLKVTVGKKGEVAYTIVMRKGVRYPADPQAREHARQEVLKQRRASEIKKYVATLKGKYVKVKKETVESLDFEAAEPGMENLLQDQRVVAEIQGEKPIRVADLSLALQNRFYHGVQQAAMTKKVNRDVPEVLDEMVTTRVLEKEALRKKIDKTQEYRNKVREFENELLFGMFVEKVINPDVRIDDEAMRRYYEDHKEKFSVPATIRGEDLAFTRKEDASDALEKLRRGADFKWAKANAPGQAEGALRNRVFAESGGPIPLKDLPGTSGQAIAGAGAGDYRFYASPEGQFLVLHILEVIPSRPYPFEDVKGAIRDILFQDGQQKSVEGWAEKLRAVSEIRIFATDSEMEKLFGPVGGAADQP